MLYNVCVGDVMLNRKSLIDFCLKYDGVYEDYPFDDFNWTVMRHRENNKCFAYIYERSGRLYLNYKADIDYIELMRNMFNGIVTPGYHMNKKYWNTVLIDSYIVEDYVYDMIEKSYNITKKYKK